MAQIGFDNAIGFHERALLFRTKRASVLANNIANADTPNYKARDMAFPASLRLAGLNDASSVHMRTTHAKHLLHSDINSVNDEYSLLYRTPSQQSIDGNTVDSNEEIAAFTQNAIDFAASFRFLNGRFKGLSKAIRGE